MDRHVVRAAQQRLQAGAALGPVCGEDLVTEVGIIGDYFMPSAFAQRAKCRPMLPSPTIPTVSPKIGADTASGTLR